MATGRAVPVHYLRGNEASWTPPQVIVFDTETRQVQDPGGETHMLRLWAARLDSRRPDSAGWTGSDTAWGRTAGQLAAQIAEWCRGQKCVWAFAHNLSFDLTISRLPGEMHALGWEVTDHAAGSETPWLRMGNNGATLTLADSWGWLRKSVADLGDMLGQPKPPLPASADAESVWLARCEADRDITADALLTVMDWWDANGLGHWSLTGSHSGWNAMRHMMPRKKVTIIPDPEQVKADRGAVYGGRRECFRWGHIPDGPFAEYDFTAAYPTIAANFPLPAKRLYPFQSLPVDGPHARGIGQGIIAEVELETAVPRWPCRIGGRVWYPVGAFRTILAGPEIAEAQRLGCLRAVGPGWAHALSWHLRSWAEWVLAAQENLDGTVPAPAVPMVKHWGRAVIGKWAARGFAKAEYGDAISAAWSYLPVWDVRAQAHGAVVEIGGRRWKCLQTEAGDNCYPAVLAYVESHTRAALSRAIGQLAPDGVICCDTDGLLLPARPGLPHALAGDVTAPLQLRRKAIYRSVRVIGPQHLVRDGRRKFSGVPGSAVQLPDGSYVALVWPRLAWQLERHPGGGYRRPEQTYTVGQSYASGWVAGDGSVLPVETRVDAGGRTVPLPWREGREDAAGAALGPVQAPAVLRVFGTAK